MEAWQQDWMKMLEAVVNGIEYFFRSVEKEMSEAADALIEFTEDVTEEVERAIAPNLTQIDQQLGEWLDPILEAIIGFESTVDQAIEPVSHTVEPILNQHPVCIGCRHYHGQMYNNVMFVCAMHPYGVAEGDSSCPDKEALPWALPRELQDFIAQSQDEEF